MLTFRERFHVLCEEVKDKNFKVGKKEFAKNIKCKMLTQRK